MPTTEHELASEVASIGAQVKSLAGVVESLARKVEGMATNQRPQWGILAAWASAILGLVALGGQIAIREPMDLMRADMKDRAITNAAGITALDNTLQREMRALDATIFARLDALDKRVQAETDQKLALNRAESKAMYWQLRYEHVINGVIPDGTRHE